MQIIITIIIIITKMHQILRQFIIAWKMLERERDNAKLAEFTFSFKHFHNQKTNTSYIKS